ncbi:hypothetical protein [Leptospira bouyouniensis]|uniref:hypothetical protein n=1 Tax=Leptospira bouyouniensis TaxID=2484911 RepID=UPI0010915452|nr:hypothetical protein [Leptospira bouyouniensis]TGM80503.1 hypothetical protein EHQ99_12600 [Leptospira bouyouniensis]
MIVRPQPIRISQIRKQIFTSFVPTINSLALIKLADSLSLNEIVEFYKNANYLTSRLISNERSRNTGEFIIVFNVERSFVMKYFKSLNIDGFDHLKFFRKSDNCTVDKVEIECIKGSQCNSQKPITINKFNIVSEQNSFKDFSKLKRNNEIINFLSKFKKLKFQGKRFSYSKEEIEFLKNKSEFTGIYSFEIVERQNLNIDVPILSESFKWKNRGICLNMLGYLNQIENNF